MRILSFVCMLFFAMGVSAQSPAAERSFDDGMKSATSGEFEKALESYRSALMAGGELSPRFTSKLHFNIGVCLYRLDRSAEAIPRFREAIRLRKGNYQKAAYALGMAEFERKNWANAEQAFEWAIKLNRSDGEAWFDLGMVYVAKSEFEKAAAAFGNSIIHKGSDSALSHNNVGVILAMKREFKQAEKEFEKALLLSSGRLIEARTNLEYCKAQDLRELLAKLVFSRKVRNLENKWTSKQM
ncbi:MAG: tetratricopeptide repeat protein [Saprospiraceae bacterium]|nr:tetratricopeptide repeat protein [Pyrinomonadaceae bacterium]